jgi:hypothetical protein
MATTEAGERHLAELQSRAHDSQLTHQADLLEQSLETLAIGDWVATSWRTDDQPRCGYVVGLVDPTLDGQPARVDIFEARPRTDRTADGTRTPCELCGTIPGSQWIGSSFRCPVIDIVEVKQVTDWHRQVCARQIIRTIDDTPGNRWDRRHTRRLLMALALIDGHEEEPK